MSNKYFSSVSPQLEKLEPTVVFDAYWRFAVERQSIFHQRRNNSPAPWTNNPILQDYKFTNTYRLLDRVSQFLIRNVIGKSRYNQDDLFFRIILFKLFNKIETWNYLQTHLGEITWKEFNFENYDSLLSRALENGRKVYFAAYIMPSGLMSFGSKRKHRNHLRLLELMMKDGLSYKVSDAHSMNDAYDILLSYPP